MTDQAALVAQVLAVLLLASALGVSPRGIHINRPGESDQQRIARRSVAKIYWSLNMCALIVLFINMVLVIFRLNLSELWGVTAAALSLLGLLATFLAFLREIVANFRGEGRRKDL